LPPLLTKPSDDDGAGGVARRRCSRPWRWWRGWRWRWRWVVVVELEVEVEVEVEAPPASARVKSLCKRGQ